MRLLVLAFMFACVLPAQSGPGAANKEFDKGTRAARQKKPEEARLHFQAAVQLDPSHARAWLELGRLQSAAGESAAARQSFETAIGADRKFFEAYVLLAKLAHDAENWKELVEITSRLLKLNAVDYPVAHLGRAVGHYHLGNRMEAEKSLRAAQEIDPDRRLPQSWRLLGLLMAERGDFAGAAVQWREFLKYAPSLPEAQEVQAKLADAEARAAAAGGGITFRAETELALIRFQVSPRRGRFLTDLGPEDFEIREDGVPQKTALFEGGRFYPRTVPLEISLLFDCSGSVRSAGNLNPHVFRESLLDEYENASIAIYGFSDRLTRLTGPSRHPQVLKKAMDAVLTIPTGITPLFQYIGETIRWASVRPGAIRMLVVFSDGESYSPGDGGRAEQAIQAALECGVAIYPVVLRRSHAGAWAADAGPSTRGPIPGLPPYPSLPERVESIQTFSTLARETGGELFDTVPADDTVPRILKAMSRRVQFDYVAGYYPARSGAEKRHHVEVLLKSKDRGTVVGGKRVVVPLARAKSWRDPGREWTAGKFRKELSR